MLSTVSIFRYNNPALEFLGTSDRIGLTITTGLLCLEFSLFCFLLFPLRYYDFGLFLGEMVIGNHKVALSR